MTKLTLINRIAMKLKDVKGKQLLHTTMLLTFTELPPLVETAVSKKKGDPNIGV